MTKTFTPIATLAPVRSNYGRLALAAELRNGTEVMFHENGSPTIPIEKCDDFTTPIKEFGNDDELLAFVYDEFGKSGIAMLEQPKEKWTHVPLKSKEDNE